MFSTFAIPNEKRGVAKVFKSKIIKYYHSCLDLKVQHKTLKKSDVLHFFVSNCTKLHHFACK